MTQNLFMSIQKDPIRSKLISISFLLVELALFLFVKSIYKKLIGTGIKLSLPRMKIIRMRMTNLKQQSST